MSCHFSSQLLKPGLLWYSPLLYEGLLLVIKILDSWNDLSWKGHKRSCHSSPLPWLGTSYTRPDCSNPLQRGLEDFKGWGIQKFSGQHIPLPHHLTGDNFLHSCKERRGGKILTLLFLEMQSPCVSHSTGSIDVRSNQRNYKGITIFTPVWQVLHWFLL